MLRFLTFVFHVWCRYGGGNSTIADEVSRFQCLFPNLNWLVWKDILPSKTRSNAHGWITGWWWFSHLVVELDLVKCHQWFGRNLEWCDVTTWARVFCSSLFAKCHFRANCKHKFCWRWVNWQALISCRKRKEDKYDGCLCYENDKIHMCLWLVDMESRLHTGAHVNFVLLTYLLTYIQGVELFCE